MITQLFKSLPAVLAAGLFSTVAAASPISPELLERLKSEGRLDEVVNRLQQARARGYIQDYSPSAAEPLAKRMPAAVDTVRVLVILVEFTDHMHDDFLPASGPAEFDSVLFSWGKMPTKSMAEFYWENSYGTFYLTGDVFGYYLMPQTYAYYVNSNYGWGPCPRCAAQMAADAVSAADEEVDFSRYDNDGDDYVEGLFVVHAGQGAEETGERNDIWSHASGIPAQLRDGVYVSPYSMEPQIRYPGVITDIGVFCHEFGHVLDLPDLYDTDYSSSGVGDWSVMSAGSWNGNGHIPAHFDAWCKARLGFITPTILTANSSGTEIPRAEENPVAYRLWTDGQIGPQYFLVENRQKALFDQALPGGGLLIWHIDETQPGNWDETHPLVAVEQADGLFQLEAGGASDAGDPWPGTAVKRQFDDFSVPDSRDYSENMTEVGVVAISDSDSLMTADLEVMLGRPYLTIVEYRFFDNQGNQIVRPEAGLNDVTLNVVVKNLGADALGASMQAAVADPEVVFSSPVSDFGDVLRDQEKWVLPPVVFSVDPDFPPTIVDFALTFSANGGAYTYRDTLAIHVGPPQFLVVDDDNSDVSNLEKYYLGYLDSLRTPHVLWGKDTLASPPADTLSAYPAIVWFTGDHRSEVLSSADVANLRALLDRGGRLLLTGQDIAQDLSDDADSTFLRDYLHVRFVPGTAVAMAQGVPGDPISDGHSLPLGGPGCAANQTSPDILFPVDAIAKTIYKYYTSANVAGVRVATGGYRAVFLGFGCEGIGKIQGKTTREQVFERVYAWVNADEPVYIPGDLNSDQNVNPLDVVLLVNHAYKGAPPPAIRNSADVNADCVINPLDVVALVNYVYNSTGQLLPGCAE